MYKGINSVSIQSFFKILIQVLGGKEVPKMCHLICF